MSANPPKPIIEVLESPAELFRAAARAFVAATQQAAERHGHCCVALAGGATPRALYALLADELAREVPWSAIGWFWSDERHVPATDPESNFGMAHEAMLARAPVRADAIFRIETERASAAEAAMAYERTLREHVRSSPGGLPRFDLVLLGMGADGHTASLFAGSPALGETSRLAVATIAPSSRQPRITLTLPVLDNAARVLLLVAGPGKQAATRALCAAAQPSPAVPASMVRPTHGTLVWLLDRAAAGTSLPNPR